MKQISPRCIGGRALPFALSMLMANLLVANTVFAQDESKELEEIVITGSYIKGSGTDEATPVDVLDGDYIRKQGALGRRSELIAVKNSVLLVAEQLLPIKINNDR